MTITFKVSPGTSTLLKAAADKNHVSVSKYIRDAVEGKLKREKKKPTLYDLMKDGIGCIDSGLSDKSTNPNYMKGYGQSRQSSRCRSALRAA